MCMRPKPFKVMGVEFEVFTRVTAMSYVRYVHFPPRIVEARLMPWEPGIPGIWFRYHDGMETIANATHDTHEIQAAIKTLSDEDQNKLAKSLEAFRAVAYA